MSLCWPANPANLFVVGCHCFFFAQVRAAGTSEVVQVLLKVGKNRTPRSAVCTVHRVLSYIDPNKNWGNRAMNTIKWMLDM